MSKDRKVFCRKLGHVDGKKLGDQHFGQKLKLTTFPRAYKSNIYAKRARSKLNRINEISCSSCISF